MRPAQDDSPGLAARIAAAALLRDVVAKGQGFDEAATPRLAPFDDRDKALVRSITIVALRRLGTLRNAIAGLLENGPPRHAADLEWTLIVAAAQILFLDVPDRAAVDLAVRSARLSPRQAPFAALVNGVLRNLSRRRATFLDPGDPLVDTPDWLAERWRTTYGEETARQIARRHRDEPTLDITAKGDPAPLAAPLEAQILPTGSLRLSTRDPVPSLPGYAEGIWWVQDAAAAIPARLLRVAPGQRVADLCAAPGGKTAQLAAAGAAVTAVDRSRERLRRLSENLTRLRLDADILVADATTLDAARRFAAVLVDAPCSATGTIRRHPDVAWTKKPADIAKLAALQARLLAAAAQMVEPGGTLVYCTCSLEPEEGESQIADLLVRDPTLQRWPVQPDEVGGLAEILNERGELRSLPSHLPHADPRQAGLDGFFAARLRRLE